MNSSLIGLIDIAMEYAIVNGSGQRYLIALAAKHGVADKIVSRSCVIFLAAASALHHGRGSVAR